MVVVVVSLADHEDLLASPFWPASVAQWLARLIIVPVVTESILTKVDGFFRVGGEPQVHLPSNGK